MTRLAALALVAALLVTSAVAQSSFTQKDFPASPTPVLMGTSFQVVLQANVVQCPTPPGVCDEQATYTLQSTSDPILSISPSSVAFSDSQREQVVTVTIGAADVSPGVVSSVWTTTADNWVANVGIGSFTVLKRKCGCFIVDGRCCIFCCLLSRTPSGRWSVAGFLVPRFLCELCCVLSFVSSRVLLSSLLVLSFFLAFFFFFFHPILILEFPRRSLHRRYPE